MKNNLLIRSILFGFCFIPLAITAQNKLSLDVATIRQMNHHVEGLNLSTFYYFNENLAGGFEVNRFFPVNKKMQEGESIRLSSWDFEINFHYLVPVSKNWRLYPVTGISHTSEKEVINETTQVNYEKFWSVNAGGGAAVFLGKWVPHMEYMFSWGEINQHIFLAGISYEIELKKKKE